MVGRDDRKAERCGIESIVRFPQVRSGSRRPLLSLFPRPVLPRHVVCTARDEMDCPGGLLGPSTPGPKQRWSTIPSCEDIGPLMNKQSLEKQYGVSDIVFLIDATGSMREAVRDVTNNISMFIDTLNTPDANGRVLVHDWRIRVIGYRGRDTDGSQWLIENPFTSDIAQAKAQLAALEAKGGGDEPESLLDAMYVIAQWPSAPKDGQVSATEWRHRHDAARIVVIFTDASAKPSFKAADGSIGAVHDLINTYHSQKLKVMLYVPDAPIYAELLTMDFCEWEPLGGVGENSAQAVRAFPGPELRSVFRQWLGPPAYMPLC